MLKDLAKIVAVDAAAAGPCPSVSPLVQWENSLSRGLLDHLVGASEQRGIDFETKCFGGA